MLNIIKKILFKMLFNIHITVRAKSFFISSFISIFNTTIYLCILTIFTQLLWEEICKNYIQKTLFVDINNTTVKITFEKLDYSFAHENQKINNKNIINKKNYWYQRVYPKRFYPVITAKNILLDYSNLNKSPHNKHVYISQIVFCPLSAKICIDKIFFQELQNLDISQYTKNAWAQKLATSMHCILGHFNTNINCIINYDFPKKLTIDLNLGQNLGQSCKAKVLYNLKTNKISFAMKGIYQKHIFKAAGISEEYGQKTTAIYTIGDNKGIIKYHCGNFLITHPNFSASHHNNTYKLCLQNFDLSYLNILSLPYQISGVCDYAKIIYKDNDFQGDINASYIYIKNLLQMKNTTLKVEKTNNVLKCNNITGIIQKGIMQKDKTQKNTNTKDKTQKSTNQKNTHILQIKNASFIYNLEKLQHFNVQKPNTWHHLIPTHIQIIALFNKMPIEIDHNNISCTWVDMHCKITPTKVLLSDIKIKNEYTEALTNLTANIMLNSPTIKLNFDGKFNQNNITGNITYKNSKLIKLYSICADNKLFAEYNIKTNNIFINATDVNFDLPYHLGKKPKNETLLINCDLNNVQTIIKGKNLSGNIKKTEKTLDGNLILDTQYNNAKVFFSYNFMQPNIYINAQATELNAQPWLKEKINTSPSIQSDITITADKIRVNNEKYIHNAIITINNKQQAFPYIHIAGHTEPYKKIESFTKPIFNKVERKTQNKQIDIKIKGKFPNRRILIQSDNAQQLCEIFGINAPISDGSAWIEGIISPEYIEGKAYLASFYTTKTLGLLRFIQFLSVGHWINTILQPNTNYWKLLEASWKLTPDISLSIDDIALKNLHYNIYASGNIDLEHEEVDISGIIVPQTIWQRVFLSGTKTKAGVNFNIFGGYDDIQTEIDSAGQLMPFFMP